MTRAKRDLQVYLEDILSAIDRIGEYTIKGRRTFFADMLIQDAVIRQISIIGEAASRLPVTFRSQHPTIPWRKIIGMRNVVIHDYAETDLKTIWLVVERDLPVLRVSIAALLKRPAA